MKLKPLPRAAASASVLLAVMSAGLPLCAAASHRDMDRPALGFNIGGGIGANSLNGEDYTGGGHNVNSTQVSFKGLAGFRLTDIISLEAQYVDFGTAESGLNHVKAHGVTAGGIFEFPLERLRPYGKAGALFWSADGDFNNVRQTDSGTDLTYGAGARWILSEQIDVRAEYERFKMNGNRVDMLSAILQFNF